MFKIHNFFNNDDMKKVDEKGAFKIIEYKRDLSVTYDKAVSEYFASQMNIHRRQLICELGKSSIITQAGAMQWTVGDVNSTTGIKGVGDFLKKTIKGSVTGESAIKPEYVGTGLLVLEPTYKHILLEDLSNWGGGMLVDDGVFLACHSTVEQKAIMRSNFSSAALGKEGLFNLELTGQGVVALESSCPREELVIIELDNDVVKIDGSLAIVWSSGLNFTVERSGKSLIGSATFGEGLVNVYRGTGRILMMPVADIKNG
ncbi:MAG: AIM24 family protein [Bacilli bacterium]